MHGISFASKTKLLGACQQCLCNNVFTLIDRRGRQIPHCRFAQIIIDNRHAAIFEVALYSVGLINVASVCIYTETCRVKLTPQKGIGSESNINCNLNKQARAVFNSEL